MTFIKLTSLLFQQIKFSLTFVFTNTQAQGNRIAYVEGSPIAGWPDCGRSLASESAGGRHEIGAVGWKETQEHAGGGVSASSDSIRGVVVQARLRAPRHHS